MDASTQENDWTTILLEYTVRMQTAVTKFQRVRGHVRAWAWGLKFEILAQGLGLGGDHDLSLEGLWLMLLW